MSNGEFIWSEQLAELLEKLKGRMGYLFEYPRGYTPEERQAILNYATRGVERGERARIESKRKGLSRLGLLGTGAEFEEEEKERRSTREAVSGLKEGLAIDEIRNRFQDILGTTGMARDLATTLMRAEQGPEVLSAARRGEGFTATQQLLQYLSLLMGGQTGMMNPYMQAVMAQMGIGGQDMSWLPFASYLLLDRT
jgi:hypothetical protein